MNITSTHPSDIAASAANTQEGETGTPEPWNTPEFTVVDLAEVTLAMGPGIPDVGVLS